MTEFAFPSSVLNSSAAGALRPASATLDNPAIATQPKVVTRDCASYKGVQALNNVNIELASNRVTALIGRPAAANRPSCVSLIVSTRFIQGWKRAARSCWTTRTFWTPSIRSTACVARWGWCFQKPVPFPMSIYDNVAYAIRPLRPLTQGRDGRQGGSGIAQRRALGRGQGQAGAERAGAVGRPATAAMHRPRNCPEPDVLLLDEPTSALDPISTAKIEQLIAELKKDYTVLIVTHNMQQAARCSDYTGFMCAGDWSRWAGPTTCSPNRSVNKLPTTSPAASASHHPRPKSGFTVFHYSTIIEKWK